MDHYLARRGHQITLTLTGSDQIVEPPNFDRVSVVFGSPAHAMKVAFGVGTATQTFTIPANSPPFIIDKAAVGDLITNSITVNGTAADVVGFWIGTYT